MRRRRAVEQPVLPESYEEVLETPADWSSMGKFDSYADEVVYEWILEGGGSEFLGDEYFGIYESVEVPGGVLVIDKDGDEWTFYYAIQTVNDQGFVSTEFYDTKAEFEKAWADLEADYEDFLEEYGEEEY